MAKVNAAARFMTEVAPPQFVSIMRRRKQVPRSLDTIAEDDRELQAYSEHHYSKSSASSAGAFTPATASSPAGGGGFMRELRKCFSSSNVVHGGQAAGAWPESRHRPGLRRAAVYEPRLHKKV